MKLLNKQAKSEHAGQLALKWEDETVRAALERIEEWRKYYVSRYDYVECDVDGEKHYIELEKPGITREFWYDDEYDSPLPDAEDARHEYFVSENLRRFNDFGIAEWHECNEALENGRACTGRHVSEPFIAVYPNGETYPVFMCGYDNLRWMEQRGAVQHPMTDEDIAAFEEIIEGQKEKFRKRLETYWKRYADKVCARGYWANR